MLSLIPRQIRYSFVFFAGLIALLAAPVSVRAQAAPAAQQADPTLAPVPAPEPEHHGRKFKEPPVTSHIEVLVLGGYNSHPITNASVIFHPLSATGRDEGSYEIKTDPDGKAAIDVIPKGTTVILQVLAPNFTTYGKTYPINDLDQKITVKLERPRAQYSTYTNENGGAATIQPGLIEPAKPVVPKPPPTAGALSGSAAANSKANRDLTGVASPDASDTSVPTGSGSSTTTSTTTTTPAAK